MNNFDNFGLLDLITILSFVVGLENLEMNIKQMDGIEQHLSKQDEKMLQKIIDQNEAIIEALEEMRI